MRGCQQISIACTHRDRRSESDVLKQTIESRTVDLRTELSFHSHAFTPRVESAHGESTSASSLLTLETAVFLAEACARGSAPHQISTESRELTSRVGSDHRVDRSDERAFKIFLQRF
jgi:hypothetical protein